MPPLTLRRNIATLALAMALALPWAAIAAPRAPRQQPAVPGLLQQLWTAISSFWSLAPAPTITPDSGCHWDPSGNCLPGSAAPAPAIVPDSGCHMDPNGGCIPG